MLSHCFERLGRSMPSKTLLAAAKVRHTAAAHPFAGLSTTVDRVDLAALMAQKDDLVSGMRRRKYLDLADDYGFEILEGRASSTRPHLPSMRVWCARVYLIATGAEPAIPPCRAYTLRGT